MTPRSPAPRAPAGPRGAVPAWADPLPLLLGTAARSRTFDLPANTWVEVLQPDPLRYGLAAMCTTAFISGYFWSPTGPVGDGGWPINQGAICPVLTLFDFGPLINSGWWLKCGTAETFVVFDLYRL